MTFDPADSLTNGVITTWEIRQAGLDYILILHFQYRIRTRAIASWLLQKTARYLIMFCSQLAIKLALGSGLVTPNGQPVLKTYI